MAVTECEEIQAWLSDYLEGTLESSRHRAVEDHLYLCPNCQAVADDLEESIKSVRDLPSADVPLGFTQKVMAQVHEEASRPTIWDRIFQPLSIKIPIQATAVALVAILAVYLYQKGDVPKREVSKSVPVESELALRQDFKERDRQLSPGAAQPMIQGQEKAELADEVGSAGSLRSSDTVLEELGAAPMRRAELAKKPAAQTGQYRLALGPSRSAEGERNVRQRVDALVKKFQGRIVEPKDITTMMKTDSPSQAEILWITIPAVEYENFKKELATLGRVRESALEPATLPESGTGRRELRIQITIQTETGPQ